MTKNTTMKRPLLALAVFSTLGILASLKSLHIMSMVIFLLFGAWVVAKYRLKPIFIVFCLLVALLTALVAYKQLNRISYLSTIENPSTLRAQLIDFEYSRSGIKAEFYIFPNDCEKREKVLVYIHDGIQPLQLSHGGYYILDNVSFQDNAPRNPGEFDFGFYLRTKGFSCAATVAADNVELIKYGNLPFQYEKILKLRDYLLSRLKISLNENEYSFVSGVLFGADETDSELTESVRKGGMAHILAVSGMHVGIIYAFFIFCFKLLFKSRAYIPALILTLMYVAISGFSVSALRAFIMLCALNLNKLNKKRYDSFNSLCLAYEIIVLVSPLSIFTISTQLSFSACTGIIFVYPILCRKAEKIRFLIIRKILSYVFIILSAAIFVIPISSVYFGEIYSCFLFTNIIIVPMIPILFITSLVYIFLSVCTFQCGIVLSILKLIIKLVGEFSDFFAALPLSVIRVTQTNYYFIILLYLGIFSLFGYIVLKNHYIKTTVFLVIALAVIGFFSDTFPMRSETKVAFLDVGCADCCVIMTRDGHNIMIDCGSRNFSGDGTASFDIIPFLSHYRINYLDAVFISHTDNDHCGALEAIISSGIVIDDLYINNDKSEKYSAIYTLAERNMIPIHSYHESDYIDEGGLLFNVLWPNNDSPFIESGNAESAVMYVYIENQSFLFCADIGENATKALTGKYILNDINIIKVAHHGSYNNALDDFLLECRPKTCIISVGVNNYSLPDEETILSITSVNAEMLSTQDSGCIIFELSDDTNEVKQYREEKLDWSGR